MGRIPLVSTSYLSLVPAGVFLLVVKRKDGALQQRDSDILKKTKCSTICRFIEIFLSSDHLMQCKISIKSTIKTVSSGLARLIIIKKPLQPGNTYLKLPVSSLFWSHLHTCRFCHLSNSSEVLTLQNRQNCAMGTKTHDNVAFFSKFINK